MKTIILALTLSLCAFAQPQTVYWSATTGNISQTGSTYTATIQQPAANAAQVYLDYIIVYCSVACTVTQYANGTAATTTLGTVVPIQPSPPNTPLTVNFFTASNVGTGTQQGGIFNLPAGATQPFCLSTACQSTHQVILPTGGTAANYSVQINGITGTSNITFFGRSIAQ